MFTSYAKLDDEHFFSKLSSDDNDISTVQPLRIQKSPKTKVPNAAELSLISRASSLDYRLRGPDHIDVKKSTRHGTPTHHNSIQASSGTSYITSERREVQKKVNSNPVDPSSSTGKSLSDSKNCLIGKNEDSMRSQTEPMPRQASNLQDVDCLNPEAHLAMRQKRNSEASASQASSRSRSNQSQGHQYSISYDHDVSLAPRSNKLSPIFSRINRVDSTNSISTVLAARGSPAPSISGMDADNRLDDESRIQYRGTRPPGAEKLSSLPAHVTGLAQKDHSFILPQNQCTSQSQVLIPQQLNPSRPSELAGDRGVRNKITGSIEPSRHASETKVVEKELQKMHITSSPPPSYSSITLATIEDMQAALNEKQKGRRLVVNVTPESIAVANPLSPVRANHVGYPNFSNEMRNSTSSPPQSSSSQQYANFSPFQSIGPSSPPPLPEGWIAHLDQNSGQYYYIHLPTQATQWEFPISPTPLNYNTASLSPGLSTYGSIYTTSSSSTYQNSLANSPRFLVQNPRYDESTISLSSQTPTTIGFTGPPSGASIELYKIAPTNGVYFGPYLRYTNIDIQKGIWLGSILLITEASQLPTIYIHKSVDLSPNPRQLKPISISIHQKWTFYRFNLDLLMNDETSDKWTYAVTTHLGCTRYEFTIAGRYETNWKLIAHSGNDFSANTSINERSKLGGIGFLWKDILHKNIDCGGFHVQLGLGDQIYANRLWKEIPLLKQWLAISGKENRKISPWTARHEEDVSHAYFHYYTSHFDQPYLREAYAQIPHILQIDHDM